MGKGFTCNPISLALVSFKDSQDCDFQPFNPGYLCKSQWSRRTGYKNKHHQFKGVICSFQRKLMWDRHCRTPPQILHKLFQQPRRQWYHFMKPSSNEGKNMCLLRAPPVGRQVQITPTSSKYFLCAWWIQKRLGWSDGKVPCDTVKPTL